MSTLIPSTATSLTPLTRPPTLPTELLFPILQHVLHTSYLTSSTSAFAALCLRLSLVSPLFLDEIARLLDPVSAQANTKYMEASATLRKAKMNVAVFGFAQGRVERVGDGGVVSDASEEEEEEEDEDGVEGARWMCWERVKGRMTREVESAWKDVCCLAELRGKMRVLRVGVGMRERRAVVASER